MCICYALSFDGPASFCEKFTLKLGLCLECMDNIEM